MTKHLKWFAWFGFGIVLWLSSCRSEELFDEQNNREEHLAQFFETKNIKDPKIKDFVEKLKLQNEKLHFVEKLADQKGLPIWDYLQFKKVKQV